MLRANTQLFGLRIKRVAVRSQTAFTHWSATATASRIHRNLAMRMTSRLSGGNLKSLLHHWRARQASECNERETRGRSCNVAIEMLSLTFSSWLSGAMRHVVRNWRANAVAAASETTTQFVAQCGSQLRASDRLVSMCLRFDAARVCVVIRTWRCGSLVGQGWLQLQSVYRQHQAALFDSL